MDLNEYQRQMVELSASTPIEGDMTLFACIGIAEEAGECMGKLKRSMRGEGFDRQGYILELGDVLGYLGIACDAQGITLEDLYDPRQIGYSTPKATFRLFRKASDLLEATGFEDNHNYIPYYPLEDKFSGLLFEIIQCVNSVGATLEEVMTATLSKLQDRLARNGNLLGSGDNR